jgi:hypothetical protein
MSIAIYDKPSVIRMTTPDEGNIAGMLQVVADAAGAGYGGYLDNQQRQRQAMLDKMRMDDLAHQRAIQDEENRIRQTNLQRQTEEELSNLQAHTSKWEEPPDSAQLIGGKPGETVPLIDTGKLRKPIISERTLANGQKVSIPATFLEDAKDAERRQKLASGDYGEVTPELVAGAPEGIRPFLKVGDLYDKKGIVGEAVKSIVTPKPRNVQAIDSTTKKLKFVSQDDINQEPDRYQPIRTGVNVNIKSPGSGSGVDASQAVAPGAQGEDLLSKLSPNDRSNVQALLEYNANPTGLNSLRNNRREYLMGLASRIDPSFSMGEYGARWKTEQDFRSGKESQNIKSLNTVASHLDKLSKAAAGLNNRSFQKWNQLVNGVLTQAGDPRVTKFNTDVKAVAGEAATLFKGTSGTDAEIKKWQDSFNSSQSPEQLKQSIAELASLIRGRHDAIVEKYKRGVGRDKSFLSPQAKRILDRLESGSDSGGDDLGDGQDTSEPSSGPSADAVRQFLSGLDQQPSPASSHSGVANKSLINKYK